MTKRERFIRMVTLDRSSSCGLFGLRPRWLQPLVNRKTFMLVYVMVSILQSMIFSYLTVVLSTVEKQFGLKSKEAAWIYSGNEISQIAFAFLIPFSNRIRKRPLAIGVASIFASLGIFIIAIPHFAGRGAARIQGNSILLLPMSSSICECCYTHCPSLQLCWTWIQT